MEVQGIFDMHCHIVPFVDDGAEDMKEALAMLKEEYLQGVRGIIVTPHFRLGMFETSFEEVKKHFELLKIYAGNIGEDLKIYLGCEFHVNRYMLSILREKAAGTMAGSRYILAEFSERDEFSYIKETVRLLRAEGYRPILAHVERYRCLVNKPETVEELLEMGAMIQVNADSVIGKEGIRIKHFCRKLLKWEVVDFVGSDCHGTARRRCRIGEAYELIRKIYGEEYADYIFKQNPREILEDAERRRNF